MTIYPLGRLYVALEGVREADNSITLKKGLGETHYEAITKCMDEVYKVRHMEK